MINGQDLARLEMLERKTNRSEAEVQELQALKMNLRPAPCPACGLPVSSMGATPKCSACGASLVRRAQPGCGDGCEWEWNLNPKQGGG